MITIYSHIFCQRYNVVFLIQGQHPDGGAHAKFTNYKFDIIEFLRLTEKAAKHVKNHPEFKKFRKVRNHDEL